MLHGVSIDKMGWIAVEVKMFASRSFDMLPLSLNGLQFIVVKIMTLNLQT